jgi:hypothetical protein
MNDRFDPDSANVSPDWVAPIDRLDDTLDTDGSLDTDSDIEFPRNKLCPFSRTACGNACALWLSYDDVEGDCAVVEMSTQLFSLVDCLKTLGNVLGVIDHHGVRSSAHEVDAIRSIADALEGGGRS